MRTNDFLMVGKKAVFEGQTVYQQGYFDDGFTYGYVYKSEKAFKENPDEVCYIPENAFIDAEEVEINGEKFAVVDGYTRKDLEEMVEGETDEEGDEITAEILFDMLIWCCPETRLSELVDY